MMNRHDMDQRIDQAVNAGIARASKTRGMHRTMLIAVVMLLMLSIGTLAATGHLGSVDWRGKPVKEEYMLPRPTMAEDEEPAAVVQKREQGNAWVDEWSESKPDIEYWMAIREDGNGSLYPPAINTESLDAVRADIERSGLRIPIVIPEGYSLKKVNAPLYFDLQLLEQTQLIEESRSPYGHRLLKYRPGEGIQRNIQEYNLTYENAVGHRLLVGAKLGHHEDGMRFGLQEGVDHSVEKVSGMDEAFMYHYPDEEIWRLITKQNQLKAPVRHVWPELGDEINPTEQVFNQATYDIHMEGGNKEEVLFIAENLK